MLWNTDDRVAVDCDVDAADAAVDAVAAHTRFDDTVDVDAALQPPLHLHYADGQEEEDTDPDPDSDSDLGAAEAAGDVGGDDYDCDYGDVPPRVHQPGAEEAVAVPQRPSDPHNAVDAAVTRWATDLTGAVGEVASDARLASQTTEVLDRKPQTARLPTLTDCCEERTSGRCKALLPVHSR